MRRFIHLSFIVSDLAAWLLVFLGLILAVSYPFAGPAHALMGQKQLPMINIVVTMVIPLLVASGAFVLTKRKPYGLLLVLLPCFIWAGTGSLQAALNYGIASMTIFGLPFVLSYLEFQFTKSNR